MGSDRFLYPNAFVVVVVTVVPQAVEAPTPATVLVVVGAELATIVDVLPLLT